MNKKKFALASVAVFVVMFVVEFLVHNVGLVGLYRQTAHLWRPLNEMKNLFWLMWLSYLVIAPILVLLYTKGYEPAKPALGQGLRFGLLIGIFLSVPMALSCYAVMPIPVGLAVGWFVGGLAEFIASGVAIALIYK